MLKCKVTMFSIFILAGCSYLQVSDLKEEYSYNKEVISIIDRRKLNVGQYKNELSQPLHYYSDFNFKQDFISFLGYYLEKNSGIKGKKISIVIDRLWIIDDMRHKFTVSSNSLALGTDGIYVQNIYRSDKVGCYFEGLVNGSKLRAFTPVPYDTPSEFTNKMKSVAWVSSVNSTMDLCTKKIIATINS